MIKRIALFLATNLAVVALLSTAMHVLGLEPWLSAQGLNVQALLVFTAVLGFGGAFLSLALSKWMAVQSVGASIIASPTSATERWLLDTVARLAEDAGIGMPDVAIYPSPDVNAFATGMSRDQALVAVSTGLLERLGPREIEAVLGHEISHIAN
jgi:heat shock protein HtpX